MFLGVPHNQSNKILIIKHTIFICAVHAVHAVPFFHASVRVSPFGRTSTFDRRSYRSVLI